MVLIDIAKTCNQLLSNVCKCSYKNLTCSTLCHTVEKFYICHTYIKILPTKAWLVSAA